MKPRLLFLAPLALVAVMGLAAFATPQVALQLAEARIDTALSKIRKQSTSVADRGLVSFDLFSRTVTVRDLVIDAPGDGSKVRIGSLTIVRPVEEGERLTAERVVFEGLQVFSAGDLTIVPRIEIRAYDGPAQGLVSTPGVGRLARSQADVIGQVSLAGASIPLIEMTLERAKVRRRIADVSIGRVSKGVIEEGSVGSTSVTALGLAEDASPEASAFEAETGLIEYRRISLPVIWRFYASDGIGSREPVVEHVSASGVRGSFALRPSGRLNLTADRLEAEGLEIRPLSFDPRAHETLARKQRRGEPLTPAEMRQQLLFAIDAARAFAFGRVAAVNVVAEAQLPERSVVSGRLALGEIGPYADARLSNAKIGGFALGDPEGSRLGAARLDLTGFDASELATYLERVGNDEILLTTTPMPVDLVRIAPRVESVSLAGARAAGLLGEIKIGGARIDIDAPHNDVPRRVAVKLNEVDAAPALGGRIEELLQVAGLERLVGSAAFSMSFDATTGIVTLDQLASRVEKLGAISATGSLDDVDPSVAVATGAEFVDKLSAITLQPFKFSFRNEGGFEALLRQAASREGSPAELYREEVAQRTAPFLTELLGPPAGPSAQALSDFIRDPRTLDVEVAPKTPDLPLIDFLQSLKLGPDGIAQTIDVTILNRR
jgi:hypothetical protein